MDVLKRAWLYITRKKKKSLIMLFILFAIATAILSGIAVKKATNIAKENATSGLSNFFSINSKSISRKTIEEILKIKDIKNYNASIDGGGNIDGA